MIAAPSYVQADTRPFEPDDLEPILACLSRPEEQAAIRWRVQQQGPNTVFLLSGDVIAAGGLQMCHRGMADPWLVITPEGRQHIRPLYRAVIAWLMEQIDAYTFHRLQAAVRVDDVAGITLLEHLGFSCEAYMRQFGDDRRDYYLYAWVRAR